MNLENLKVQELSVEEQINVDGGKNILEWIAYGVGSIHGAFAGASSGAYSYSHFDGTVGSKL